MVQAEAERRLHDLEIFHKAAMNREERILELKEEIKQLRKQLNKK